MVCPCPNNQKQLYLAQYKGWKLTSIAKFVVSVRGYSVDDEDLVCLNLFVDFVSTILIPVIAMEGADAVNR
jgi:hypothetical protein